MRDSGLVRLMFGCALGWLMLAGLPAGAVTWLTVNGAGGGTITTPGAVILRADVGAPGGSVTFVMGSDLNGNGGLDAGESVSSTLVTVQDGGWTDEEAATGVVQFVVQFRSLMTGPIVIQAVDDNETTVGHPYTLDYLHPMQSVSGAVRYDDGTPAAGIKVAEYVGDSQIASFTDGSGSYTLYLGQGGHIIQAESTTGVAATPKADWVSLGAGATNTGENFTIGLHAGPRIVGTVTQADTGHPVPGVSLTAMQTTTHERVYALTDVEGNYILPVTAATWQVSANTYGVAGPYGSPVPQNVVVGTSDAALNLALPRLGDRVYGIVTSGGSPVPSAWVTAAGATHSSGGRTNAQGHYEIWLPADSYQVKAHDLLGDYAFPYASVTNVATPPSSRVDLAMIACTATMSGRVIVAGTSTGIARAEVGASETVDITPVYSDTFGTTADGLGYFSMKMPPGPFETWARSSIYDSATGAVSFTFPPSVSGVIFPITSNHVPPTLRDASISPPSGGFGGQKFTFAVTYAQANNTWYGDVYVVVDGWPHRMIQTSWGPNPADWINGQTFGCDVRIPAGTHSYWFGAIDVVGMATRLPAVGTLSINVAPSGTIAGTVVDSGTSDPISGARISVKLGPPTYAAINDCVSDSSGHYAVTAPAGTYSVPCFAEGYLAANWSNIQVTNSHTTTLDFRLDPACTITGKVTVSPGGTPLQGAQLKIAFANPHFERTTTSDANGNYTFPDLFAGPYTVTASKAWYTTQTRTNFMVTAAGPNVANFSLSATGEIDGQVLAAGTSAPIQGADVRAYVGSTLRCTATTDASGVYHLNQNLPTGTYAVIASKGGFMSQTKAGISVTAGVISYCNFNLAASGALNGQVRFKANGANIAGAEVKAYLNGALKGTATTDANGIYLINADLASGSYVVSAAKDGFMTQTKSPISVTTGATAYCNFNLDASAMLTGQVNAKASATPLAGATVKLSISGVIKATATTGTNGVYAIARDLPAGSYLAAASEAGYVTQAKAANVVAGVTSYLNFNLGQSGGLMGQVRISGTTTYIAGATVSCYLASVLQATGTTDVNGIYAIGSDLPAGTYTVVASKAGYARQEKVNIVVTAGVTTYVNLALLASGKIKGQVTADGSPVIGATVAARMGGIVRATGVTVGPYGIYEIASDLPAGTYSVLCQKSGYRDFGRIGIAVTSGATTYVNFNLQPR